MSALVNLQFPAGGVNQSSKTAMWESSLRGTLQSSSSPQEISTSTLEQNVKSSPQGVVQCDVANSRKKLLICGGRKEDAKAGNKAVVFFRNWFVLPNNCPPPPTAKKITQLAARMCSFLGRRLVCWRQWHTEGLFADTLADVCFHCRLFIGRCGMNWVLLDWSKKNKPGPSDPPREGNWSESR